MKNLVRSIVLLSLFLSGCGDSGNDDGGGGNGQGTGPAGPVPVLGAAAPFAVFASSAAAVTLAADSVVNGDIGLNPAGTCNNCVSGVTLNGALRNGDAIAIAAQADFNAAYVDASTRVKNACPITAALEVAQAACAGATPGPVYPPGLYNTASGLDIGVGKSITLDAGGNPNAVFVFQAGTGLTTGAGSNVILAGGALAKNVFWAIGTAATLGVSSIFRGTIMANTAAVTSSGGTAALPSTVEGRLFSHGAAINVGASTVVSVPK